METRSSSPSCGSCEAVEELRDRKEEAIFDMAGRNDYMATAAPCAIRTSS